MCQNPSPTMSQHKFGFRHHHEGCCMTHLEPHPDQELDATGLRCPIPLLKTRMELKRLEEGQILLVLSTDAGTKRDFHSFVAATNHALIKEEDDGSGVYRF